MLPDKAPGPDGYYVSFYKEHWDIVGEEVSAAVLIDVLNNGKSFDLINATNIVLIPKKSKPSYPSDFHPIVLRNVLYKLVSKILVNRMISLIDHVVDISQSAFIAGRYIFDNNMVAHEMIHVMKNKTSGHNGFVGVNLDMSKAYDRIKWSYLKEVMSAMSFSVNWIDKIMNCVMSVSYSLIISGDQTNSFKPSYGFG